LPGYKSITEAESWILEDTSFLSLRVIAERVDISETDLLTISSRYFNATIDENLGLEKRRCLKAMTGDPDFLAAVAASSDRHLNDCALYFTNCGLFSAVRSEVAIIDVGWSGRLQRSLENIAEKIGMQESCIRGYYLGLSATTVDAYNGRKHGFLMDPARKSHKAENWVERNKSLFEYFLRADHPSTVAYEVGEGGVVAPVFGKDLGAGYRAEVR